MKHPLGSLSLAEVKVRAREIVDEVVRILTTKEEILENDVNKRLLDLKLGVAEENIKKVGSNWDDRTVQVPDSLDAINEVFYEKKWTDGLPIVPPTKAMVEKMLEVMDRDPNDVIAHLPPLGGRATVAKIAVNAVMAGCRPDYMPVLIGTVQAMRETRFNLDAIQTTTNPSGVLMILNGPIRDKLRLNSGAGVLGPGFKANATLGRAIRLILLNIGGARPGELDKSTQGTPGKYSFCIAENEEENPWEPFHVERGYEKKTSTITVVGAVSTLNITDSASTTAESLLTTLAGGMIPQGTQNFSKGGDPLLILCPEHASMLAREGMTKRQVKEYLFQHARLPFNAFSKEVLEKHLKKRRPHLFKEDSQDKMVPITDQPDDIMIIVCGGPGRHSVFIPTFAYGLSVTRAIEKGAINN